MKRRWKWIGHDLQMDHDNNSPIGHLMESGEEYDLVKPGSEL